MEIKFYTGEKILNLSGQKITVQDSNSRMSDKMFSKYFFPFEIYMNEEFINNFGDFESYDSLDLENTFEGTLLFENKIHEAKLVLSSVEGKLLTGQIDFGFEDLPNFSKKLSELPLEKFKVADIHLFAKNICAKKYPETNFNFPRMYTSKYSPDNSVWDAFDGYYNDLNPDGTEMRRNYIDGDSNIYNINIIHPCPHFLYVLKTGFSDAKLTLAGDILTDPIFAQRWMFSGTEYFSNLTQKRLGMVINAFDYDTLNGAVFPLATYIRTLEVKQTNEYEISGGFMLNSGGIKIFLNDSLVFQYNSGGLNDYKAFSFKIQIPANSVLRVGIVTFFLSSQTEPVLQMDLIGKVLYDDSETSEGGEDLGVITNLNEVDLKKAVPDMTFGDFINAIRNRFNYDVTIEDNVAVMNRIGDKEPTDIKDFTQFEIQNPKRELLQKKSFLLRSPELDNAPQNSMYYDKDGAFLNKAPKEDTVIIESNVIILQTGVPKPLGYDTAIIKKDTSDSIQLVWYDGLSGVQNNAKNPLGAEFPELFYSHWEKWLRQRVRGTKFQWKFYCDAEQFDYLINNHIYAYKNIHNIVSWTKDLVENTYEVDIVTESI